MSEILDEYAQNLEEHLKTLQDCQKKQQKTCMKCEMIFECEIRKAYIQSVYSSMNRGKTGGFEF